MKVLAKMFGHYRRVMRIGWPERKQRGCNTCDSPISSSVAGGPSVCSSTVSELEVDNIVTMFAGGKPRENRHVISAERVIWHKVDFLWTPTSDYSSDPLRIEVIEQAFTLGLVVSHKPPCLVVASRTSRNSRRRSGFWPCKIMLRSASSPPMSSTS
jgi:hypothetical protein